MPLSQVLNQVLRNSKEFKQRVNKVFRVYEGKVIDILYQNGLPWRRIANSLKIFVATLSFFLILLAVIYGLNLVVQVLELLAFLIGWAFRMLAYLGDSVGLIGADFATYVAAQVVADIVFVFLAAIATLLLLGRVQRGLQFPTHKIRITGGYSRTDEDGVITYYVKVSNEEGDEPAPYCRARITFRGLTWRDVADIPNGNAQYCTNSPELMHTNYRKTTTLPFLLPWEDGGIVHTILSGDYAHLPILRLFRETDILEHFEVPCIIDTPHGKDTGVGVCLKPLGQRGEIRIVPERGRFQAKRFSISWSSGSSFEKGKWVVIA